MLCVLSLYKPPSYSGPILMSSLYTVCIPMLCVLYKPPLPHTAVLVLFLFKQLGFTEDSSTAIYHAFIMLCYLLPLLGALIADSCLGKYMYVPHTPYPIPIPSIPIPHTVHTHTPYPCIQLYWLRLVLESLYIIS